MGPDERFFIEYIGLQSTSETDDGREEGRLFSAASVFLVIQTVQSAVCTRCRTTVCNVLLLNVVRMLPSGRGIIPYNTVYYTIIRIIHNTPTDPGVLSHPAESGSAKKDTWATPPHTTIHTTRRRFIPQSF